MAKKCIYCQQDLIETDTGCLNCGTNNRIDPEWRELGGCFLELLYAGLGSGVGCVVPTLLVAALLVWGGKAPVQHIGSRVAARIKQIKIQRRKTLNQIATNPVVKPNRWRIAENAKENSIMTMSVARFVDVKSENRLRGNGFILAAKQLAG